ncbi:MAG: nuclear transport factor 2 family protein [Planctomycetaceae bacterium]
MNDSDVVSCNGRRISELRLSCGMTQEALAADAGYSVRLIHKAEKSGQIRFSTLVALATAFQRRGINVSPRDLCTDPVSVVQAFVEAYRVYEAEMVDRIRHLLSPDLQVFVAGDPSQIPFSGTYHGPDGLQEFWNRFFALIERYDKNAMDLQYYVCGQDVVAYGTEKGRLKGQVTNEAIWLSLKFEVRDGLIVRFEDYFDTASAQGNIAEFRARMQRDAEES